MTTFASKLYRDLSCASAAVLITLVLSVSFLQSTSRAPFHATRAGTTQLA